MHRNPVAIIRRGSVTVGELNFLFGMLYVIGLLSVPVGVYHRSTAFPNGVPLAIVYGCWPGCCVSRGFACGHVSAKGLLSIGAYFDASASCDANLRLGSPDDDSSFRLLRCLSHVWTFSSLYHDRSSSLSQSGASANPMKSVLLSCVRGR